MLRGRYPLVTTAPLLQVLLCSSGFWVSTAGAQQESARRNTYEGSRVELRYRAELGCPDEVRLSSEVHAILERDVFAATDVTHRLDVIVTSNPVRAVITLSDADDGEVLGTRILEAEGTCESALLPLALVAAMLVDLSRDEMVLHVPLQPHRQEAQTVELGLSVGGGVQLALGPTPQGVGLISGSLVPWSWLSVYAELLVAPYASVRHDEVGVELTAVAGTLGVCPRLALADAHALEACAELGAGGVWGSGRDLDIGATSVVPWVFAGGAIRARFTIAAPWFVTLVVRVGGTIVRPAFYYRDEGLDITSFLASEVDAMAAALLGLRIFP